MDNKFKMFVITAIIILTLGIAGVTYLFLSQDNDKAEVAKETEQIKMIEVPMGEEIMTNIALGEDEIQHFAKVKISLGINQNDEKAYNSLNEVLVAKAASIRNELIDVVGDQTYDMLIATDGKVKLADEIVLRLNKLLGTDLICEVYYQDYFVQ